VLSVHGCDGPAQKTLGTARTAQSPIHARRVPE
jgi:hypothetical protein